MNSVFLRLGNCGLRGIVGHGMDPVKAGNYASAFGSYLESGSVVIGRDTRTSSETLSMAATAALMECGCSVIDAGVVPAPVIHFLVKHYKAAGGMLIGGGHHPEGWNALVPLNSTGAYINNVQAQTVMDIYHSHIFTKADYRKLGSYTQVPASVTDLYLKHANGNINTQAIQDAAFRVVIDFCNGSGSILKKEFAKQLGIDLIPLNDELSGFLPHMAEPRPRAGKQVKALMAPLNADIGFILNSDASRVSIVTNDGTPLSEELTYPIVAEYVLSQAEKNSSFVTNSCSSKTLDRLADDYSCILEKTHTGQGSVIDKMSETSSILSGEGSGGVAFADGVNGFDAFRVIATILEAMAVRKVYSSALAENFNAHIVKKQVTCESGPTYALLKHIKPYFESDASNVDESEGLRFDWNDAWLSFRISKTEPALRIIAESENRERAENLSRKAQIIAERFINNV